MGAVQRELLEERSGLAAGLTKARIHSMLALSAGTTLHLYAPSITGMRVFDTQARQTLIVADDCGAWLPDDPQLVQKRTDWARSQQGSR